MSDSIWNVFGQLSFLQGADCNRAKPQNPHKEEAVEAQMLGRLQVLVTYSL